MRSRSTVTGETGHWVGSFEVARRNSASYHAKNKNNNIDYPEVGFRVGAASTVCGSN